MRSIQPKAFIFDMDGTMIDSMPFHAQSWEVFCASHGIDMPLAEVLRRTTGRTARECMVELFGREVSAEEALAFSHEKEDIYRQLFAPVFAEVAGFAQFVDHTVASGLAWGVGTAGDQHNIRFAFGHLKMRHTPLTVVGGDQGFRGKPEPDIFLAVAEGLGIDPRDCVVFEDAPFGIEAARRAGMNAVALCTSHPQDQLQGPHVLAHGRNYHELMAQPLLAQWLGLN